MRKLSGERRIPWSERSIIKELRFTIRRIKESPLSVAGVLIILFFASVALLAPILAPARPGRDPYQIPREGYSPIPQPPSPGHPFGVTEGQFDLYYGIIWGTRSAFKIGILVVACNSIMGIVIGAIAAYYGGVVDEAMMRVTDVILAFPNLVLAMALVTALAKGQPSLDIVTLTYMLVGWPSYARVMRGQVLKLKQEDYVEAAKAVGCSDLRVMLKHILPNAVYPVLIMASLDTGSIVILVAALSFLGLGAPIGYADWGQLVALSRNWIVGGLKYWYTYLLPGVFLFTFVLGWNLLGDAFRDILDPTLRRR